LLEQQGGDGAVDATGEGDEDLFAGGHGEKRPGPDGFVNRSRGRRVAGKWRDRSVKHTCRMLVGDALLRIDESKSSHSCLARVTDGRTH
jgi:hypothetical protein